MRTPPCTCCFILSSSLCVCLCCVLCVCLFVYIHAHTYNTQASLCRFSPRSSFPPYTPFNAVLQYCHPPSTSLSPSQCVCVCVCAPLSGPDYRERGGGGGSTHTHCDGEREVEGGWRGRKGKGTVRSLRGAKEVTEGTTCTVQPSVPPPSLQKKKK